MSESPDTFESNTSGLWMTVAELAARKGVTRQSAHERVARLKAAGLLTPRPGKGRSSLINLAEYDRAVGDVADLGREQGAKTKRGTEEALPGQPVYTREQARKTAYEADLKELELAERMGKVVRADGVVGAAGDIGREIATIVDGLAGFADDLAAAVGKDGSHGARVLLKRIALDQRGRISEALARLGSDAPEIDPPFSQHGPGELMASS